MTLRDVVRESDRGGAEARWKIDTRTIVVNVPPARAFEPVRRLGGATGWYFGNLLWKARGVGGPATRRRRHAPRAPRR